MAIAVLPHPPPPLPDRRRIQARRVIWRILQKNVNAFFFNSFVNYLKKIKSLNNALRMLNMHSILIFLKSLLHSWSSNRIETPLKDKTIVIFLTIEFKKQEDFSSSCREYIVHLNGIAQINIGFAFTVERHSRKLSTFEFLENFKGTKKDFFFLKNWRCSNWKSEAMHVTCFKLRSVFFLNCYQFRKLF